MTKKNVFVVAPDELHWAELTTVAGVGEEIAIHPLLDADEVVHTPEIDAEMLLANARAQLDAFRGPVDAIIAQWDFPTTMIVPILCQERGLRSPSIDAVVRCGHKYWSRVAQRDAIGEMTPAFTLIDPMSPDAADTIDLPFPFWMKPVKSFASQLGFAIHNRAELDAALKTTREEIARLAGPYDDLARIAGVPDEVRAIGGMYCIAEELLVGVQVAHEGFVQGGEVVFHGTLDMEREDNAFTRFVWPSQKPDSVIERMEDATRRLLTHIGYDDGCFNAEFLWDPETDRLSFIEVNPRISQSHSPMCVWVDGRSNHEVAIDVALGREPLFDPGAGDYAVAAKFMEHVPRDGVVERAPEPDELAALEGRYRPAIIQMLAEPGQRLSELLEHDAYSYCYADVYMAAHSREELLKRHDALVSNLPFEVGAG